MYDDIFGNLNAAQAILAVLIFREVENERKRPSRKHPEFIPYASHYISMLIGRRLLRDQNVNLSNVSHLNFKTLVKHFQQNKVNYHTIAVNEVSEALKQCYGNRNISLQQLSGTFRRGDLLEMLGTTIF